MTRPLSCLLCAFALGACSNPSVVDSDHPDAALPSLDGSSGTPTERQEGNHADVALAPTDVDAYFSPLAYVEQGACGAVELILKDVAPSALRTSIRAARLQAFADEGCRSPLIELEIPAGADRARFYVQGVQLGVGMLQAPEFGARSAVRVGAFEDRRAEQTLVVYNANVPDSAQLAAYYADARGIDESQLCGVHLRPGPIAGLDETLAASRELINDCLCPRTTVRSCSPTNVDALEQANIMHLAFMYGMPSNIWDVPLPGTDANTFWRNPSFGYVFTRAIYVADNSRFFETEGDVYRRGEVANTSAYTPRPFVPEDRHFGWSYLQATTVASTQRLIDRTLEAERRGFSGNLFASKASDPDIHVSAYRDFVDGHSAECLDYLRQPSFDEGAPANTWTPERCRFGTTDTTNAMASPPVQGAVPGEVASTVPQAVRAGAFFGGETDDNGQNAFDGFENLLNWRVTGEACEPLCANLPASQQADCRMRSQDIFQELNSACVGVEPGFFAWQERSYTAKYNGFFPEGWLGHHLGDWPVTPPVQIDEGGYQDARFTDAAYQHFGVASHDSVLDTRCGPELGVDGPCDELVAMRMTAEVDTSHLPAEARPVRVRFRYRTGDADPDVRIILWRFSARGQNLGTSSHVLSIESAETWQEASFETPFELGERLRVSLITQPGRVLGYFDLDGVEIQDVLTGEHLLDAERGGFAVPTHHQTHVGDWPATVIDRLGGVFYYGSQSHFSFGGFSPDGRNVLTAMSSGLTIGESVQMARPTTALHPQGDPLYRPFAARLGVNQNVVLRVDDSFTQNRRLRTVVTAANADDLEFDVTAWNGERGGEWRVEACESLDMESCHGQWQTVLRGIGRAQRVPVDLSELFDFSRDYPLALRVRVGEGDSAIASVVTLFVSSLDREDCVGDQDGDFHFDWQEYRALTAFNFCTTPDPDLDGDGEVNDADFLLWYELEPGHPQWDLNGDGLSDLEDEILYFEDYGCQVYTPAHDANEDGVFDQADKDLLEGRIGACWWLEAPLVPGPGTIP
ncbi:MAG: hypothetical protein AAF938_01815 [Myxococcota bacterium]